jgi:hypothetical protein
MTTVDQLQAMLAGRTVPKDGYGLPGVPPLECKDGFSVSMQASEWLYCSPRDSVGPWTAVELGFPSWEEPLLMPWCEDKMRPTQTVYGWVPLDVVAQVVEAHGGLV